MIKTCWCCWCTEEYYLNTPQFVKTQGKCSLEISHNFSLCYFEWRQLSLNIWRIPPNTLISPFKAFPAGWQITNYIWIWMSYWGSIIRRAVSQEEVSYQQIRWNLILFSTFGIYRLFFHVYVVASHRTVSQREASYS